MYQRNPNALDIEVRAHRVHVLFLALTFGTLLSSQGTDAHRHRALALIWGNLLTLPGPIQPVNVCWLWPGVTVLTQSYTRLLARSR